MRIIIKLLANLCLANHIPLFTHTLFDYQEKAIIEMILNNTFISLSVINV